MSASGPSLGSLLAELRFDADTAVVVADDGEISLSALRAMVEQLADTLRAAGIGSGQPVGALVGGGPDGVVAMFATWAAGGTYVPINRRLTPAEVSAFLAETPVALTVGSTEDLGAHDSSGGAVEYGPGRARIRRSADPAVPGHDADVALVLRTSGTTGRPKAVLLRHSGTIDAIDASLRKLRGGRAARPVDPAAPPRMNLIPVSLALWAGMFNTLFAFRAGSGIVLLDRFTPADFVRVVRAHDIRSTVLPPALIMTLNDAADIDDLGPLRIVRSITAPLPPEAAHTFHRRFGTMVLNSYGQTELGGEVVGWTAADVREFGETKLGAVGRPYADVDLLIRDETGSEVPTDAVGEIHVRSPFRMQGYAGSAEPDRFVNGYLRTGDIGRLDVDGFLWVHGRISDMINRGGLKVIPDEVEDVLRRHPAVVDACVAAIPDRRLGEVPHAWVISDGEPDTAALTAWCRRELAPYKVPTGFTRVAAFPRSEIGKVQRRVLAAEHAAGA